MAIYSDTETLMTGCFKQMLYPYAFTKQWPPPLPSENGKSVSEIYGMEVVKSWPYSRYVEYAAIDKEYAEELREYEKTERIRSTEWVRAVEECNKWTLGIASVVFQLSDRHFKNQKQTAENEKVQLIQAKDRAMQEALDSKLLEIHQLRAKVDELSEKLASVVRDCSTPKCENCETFNSEAQSITVNSKAATHGSTWSGNSLKRAAELQLTTSSATSSCSAISRDASDTQARSGFMKKRKVGSFSSVSNKKAGSQDSGKGLRDSSADDLKKATDRLNTLQVVQLRRIVKRWSNEKNKLMSSLIGQKKSMLVSKALQLVPKEKLSNAIALPTTEKLLDLLCN